MSYTVQNPGRGSKDDYTPPLHNTAPRGSRCRGSVRCELILPHTWHTPKIPLSLEGEEGTGAEPAAWRPARHLLAVALQHSTAPEGSLPYGQRLPSLSNFTHQLIQDIPMENVLLPYSQEKQWNTNSLQTLDSTVESMLQDIPRLYDAFSSGLCYSPSLEITARKEIIPKISALKQTFTTTTSPHPCLTWEETGIASLSHTFLSGNETMWELELVEQKKKTPLKRPHHKTRGVGRKGSATSHFTSSSWGLTRLLHV